jgi:beta-N-acetylglucosaminidase
MNVMEVVRCSRCGAFYTNGGYVCAKCANKDNIELSQFKNFVEENGLEVNSLNQISSQTGILEKNLNRFLSYDGLEGYKKLFK